MDGDWAEVKKPVKKQAPAQTAANMPATYGGKKGKKNVLVAGAVRPVGKYGGQAAHQQAAQSEVMNHASAVADYDYGVDEDGGEEMKFELVSHTCSMSVKEARTAAKLTQAQLATKVNEKVSSIHDVENGTARYSADLINRIERALNCKIERGRKKANKGRR